MNELKIGDVVENSIWVSGDESEELKIRYKSDVREALEDLCVQAGYEHGPVRMHEKKPGDDRVPPVPDHINGSKVRLLVVETELVEKVVSPGEPSFINNLEPKDLIRLRKITRDSAFKQMKIHLTNDQVDEIIEMLGPDSAIDALRAVH